MITRLAFALSLFAALPATAETTAFHHKQWQARCSPDYCTLHPRAHAPLALVRSALGGPWVMTFYSAGMIETSEVQIDGQVMRWRAGDEMALPAALLDGTNLEIVDDQQGFTDGISLAGIKAAMLWAEDQQGEIPTERRLAIRQPDWSLLAQEAEALTGEMCEDPPPEGTDAGDIPQELLGHPELRVVSNICWMAAYNVGSIVYLLGPDVAGIAPVRAAALTEFDVAVWDLAVHGLDWNPQEFSTIDKGRGIGDCFTEETWRFDHFVYRLAQRIEDNDCDGKYQPEVTWPE